jgi:SWI/SNF-related matrix-associated actin-dependent regulator 1 of chromatin subfamily A
VTISIGRDGVIDITFAYNPHTVDLVKQIPDRKWEPKRKTWTVPATPWHARQLIGVVGKNLTVGPDIHYLAKKDQYERLDSEYDIEPLNNGLAPFPYQLAAVEFLQILNGRALLSDDCGLGKTIEVLLWARHRRLTKVLVVCPASVLYKWQNEAKRWYPEMGDCVQVVAHTDDVITQPFNIMSYDIMTRKQLQLEGKYDLIVWDECVRLRSHKTKRFAAAKQVAMGVPYIIGLSGTPILHRPMELYNILHLLNERAFNWYSYANRYCLTAKDGYKGAKNLEELEDRLRGIMLRRFKREVSDQLPPFTRTVVPLRLEEGAMKTYRHLFDEDPVTIREQFPNSKGYFVGALDWLGALRQYLERARAESVAEWAEDFLDGSENRKLVIYCGFKATVVALEDKLYQHGVAKITGEVPNKQRQEIIDRWQNEMTERVMLLTDAGGEGIDLFGKNGIDCSTILFAGRQWSPAIEEQIEGRLDRTGQEYPVEAVYLVAEGTIDEDIHALIEGKREVVRRAVRLDDVPTVTGDLLSLLESRGKHVPRVEKSN